MGQAAVSTRGSGRLRRVLQGDAARSRGAPLIHLMARGGGIWLIALGVGGGVALSACGGGPGSVGQSSPRPASTSSASPTPAAHAARGVLVTGAGGYEFMVQALSGPRMVIQWQGYTGLHTSPPGFAYLTVTVRVTNPLRGRSEPLAVGTEAAFDLHFGMPVTLATGGVCTSTTAGSASGPCTYGDLLYPKFGADCSPPPPFGPAHRFCSFPGNSSLSDPSMGIHHLYVREPGRSPFSNAIGPRPTLGPGASATFVLYQEFPSNLPVSGMMLFGATKVDASTGSGLSFTEVPLP